MKKVQNINELYERLQGKSSTTAIKELADLDFFRKQVSRTVEVPDREIRIPLENVLNNIPNYLIPVESGDNFKDSFRKMLTNLQNPFLDKIKNELGSKNFDDIESYSIGIGEYDQSFLDEPKHYVMCFVLHVKFKPKSQPTPQTDKEVVNDLKSWLGSIKAQNSKKVFQKDVQ